MEFKDRLQFLFVIRQINFSSSFFSLLSKENQFNFSWRGGSQIAFMIFLFCFCFSFSSSSSYIYIMTKFLLDFRKKKEKLAFSKRIFWFVLFSAFFLHFLVFIIRLEEFVGMRRNQNSSQSRFLLLLSCFELLFQRMSQKKPNFILNYHGILSEDKIIWRKKKNVSIFFRGIMSHAK